MWELAAATFAARRARVNTSKIGAGFLDRAQCVSECVRLGDGKNDREIDKGPGCLQPSPCYSVRRTWRRKVMIQAEPAKQLVGWRLGRSFISRGKPIKDGAVPTWIGVRAQTLLIHALLGVSGEMREDDRFHCPLIVNSYWQIATRKRRGMVRYLG
ncbi:hypothetical protein ACRALDRAFT_205594 [Sodiomyces alcalophilus JCM 7366]|uniref:uncharacterized protein n=1 Tax=Sodiomyces alcalophilus JCM 7366 TaxID=591952 RepID=UPI0039B44030